MRHAERNRTLVWLCQRERRISNRCQGHISDPLSNDHGIHKAVKLLKDKSYIFIQRGKLTRYAVTGDLRIEISVNGIPMVSYLPARHYSDAPAPAECYRIHLTTPDPEGESI